MLEIDREIFDKNLLLTQAYCEMQLANKDKSTAEILRSFNPEYHGQKIFSYESTFFFKGITGVVWKESPLWDNLELYTKLFEEQLSFKKRVVPNIEHSDVKGKLLGVKLNESFWDGCSEGTSDGFIDQFDCPPIDTWVYMIDDSEDKTLFTWVPQQFVELVDVAIEVNAMDCLSWITIK